MSSALNHSEEAVHCARLLSLGIELETTLYTRHEHTNFMWVGPGPVFPGSGRGDRDEMMLKGDGEFDGF
jgi:hypothetical protein